MLNTLNKNIHNDKWMKKKFVVKSIIENIFVNRYSLYYRDCIKILKFFMKHEFFTNNLIYAFIRKYEITIIFYYISVTINLHIKLKLKYLDQKKLTSWQFDSYFAFRFLNNNNQTYYLFTSRFIVTIMIISSIRLTIFQIV